MLNVCVDCADVNVIVEGLGEKPGADHVITTLPSEACNGGVMVMEKEPAAAMDV
jgi:hypothetical protein